jgi:hypothetical protein
MILRDQPVVPQVSGEILRRPPSGSYTILVSQNDGANTYYGNIIDAFSAQSPSNPRSGSFNTDVTAPTTTDNFTHNDTWVASNQSITLTPADATSGVASTKYCTDSNNTCDPSTGTTYTTAISFTTEGTTYLRYSSTDNAGNVQTTVSRTIKIDKTNPTVDAGSDQDKTSQFTQASTDSDSLSGINSYLWSQVSGPGTITFGSAALSDTTISASADGDYVIRMTVTDRAGNSASDTFNLTWSTTSGGGGGDTGGGDTGGGSGGGSSGGSSSSGGTGAGAAAGSGGGNGVGNFFNNFSNTVNNATNNLINPVPAVTPSQVAPTVPVQTPTAFQPLPPIVSQTPGGLQISDLTSDLTFFAQRFFPFNTFLRGSGVDKVADLPKLQKLGFTLPGFSQSFASAQPIGPESATDVVFIKTGNNLIDIHTTLSFDANGHVNQQINLPTSDPLQLYIKPGQPVKNITGFIVLSQKNGPQAAPAAVSLRSIASWFFPSLNTKYQSFLVDELPVQLLLEKFEYKKQADGFYVADINSPTTEGSYDIINVMDYQDVNLVSKQITLAAVVYPEGYVYENVGGLQARIPGAKVTLYWFNPKTQAYEVWPADTYLQQNPYVTDGTGRYSFVAPEGTYYITAQADGYPSYKSDSFIMTKGNSAVFMNIELKKGSTMPWWVDLLLGAGGMAVLAGGGFAAFRFIPRKVASPPTINPF